MWQTHNWLSYQGYLHVLVSGRVSVLHWKSLGSHTLPRLLSVCHYEVAEMTAMTWAVTYLLAWRDLPEYQRVVAPHQVKIERFLQGAMRFTEDLAQ
jgi:hypothetical protein